MAEGDTILRAARRIEAAIGGEQVQVSTPNRRGAAVGTQRLDGKTLEQVSARGKHLLLEFGELSLHSHLGMSGSWHVYPRGATWRKPAPAAWAVLKGKSSEAVQFGGPTLRLLRTDALRRDRALRRLGPDILAADFDREAITLSLRAQPHRALGDALLDQALVAGIGNIFKSEACFAARLDPWRPIGALSARELERVVEAAHELMRDAVENGRQTRAVYKRAGHPCLACRTPILSRGQGDANRTTCWCSRCQAASSDG